MRINLQKIYFDKFLFNLQKKPTNDKYAYKQIVLYKSLDPS